MRSIFFERSKSSGVAVTQPAGRGGKSKEFKRESKYSKGFAGDVPNPIKYLDTDYTEALKKPSCRRLTKWLDRFVSLLSNPV